MRKKEEILSKTQERLAHQRVKQRLRARSTTEDVLCQLLEFGGAMAMKYTRPSRSILDLMHDQEYDAYRAMLHQERRSIKRLHRRRLLTIERQGADLEVVLTGAGWEEVLRRRILSCEETLPNSEYCIVAFDIPQHARTQRDMFRYFLKSAGFCCLQMSVWYTGLDVVDELLLLIRHANYPFKVAVFRSKLLFSQNIHPGEKSG